MAQYENKKILLHACCGICSAYPISMLQEKGYSVSVYFCNPNLDTKEEFQRRLDAQRTVCENLSVELISEEYNHKEYLEKIKGLENEPEKGKRCLECIQLRLSKTAKYAKDNGYKIFTTSLVISPHKNYEKITEIGKTQAKIFDLEYLDINFKKKDGFLKTNIISKELGIYRQNYCGCEFAKNRIK